MQSCAKFYLLNSFFLNIFQILIEPLRMMGVFGRWQNEAALLLNSTLLQRFSEKCSLIQCLLSLIKHRWQNMKDPDYNGTILWSIFYVIIYLYCRDNLIIISLCFLKAIFKFDCRVFSLSLFKFSFYALLNFVFMDFHSLLNHSLAF